MLIGLVAMGAIGGDARHGERPGGWAGGPLTRADMIPRADAARGCIGDVFRTAAALLLMLSLSLVLAGPVSL